LYAPILGRCKPRHQQDKRIFAYKNTHVSSIANSSDTQGYRVFFFYNDLHTTCVPQADRLVKYHSGMADTVSKVLHIFGGEGGSLDSDWVGGSALNLLGVQRADFPLRITTAEDTHLTSVDVRLTVSDDAESWVPIPTVSSVSGAAAITHRFDAVAGQVVLGRMLSSNHACAIHCRLEVKAVADGALEATDIVSADLCYV
jgi:hypothetical protein